MEESATVATLTALAQTARLRVSRALAGADSQVLTPGEPAAIFDLPASTQSSDLQELMRAGLVIQVCEAVTWSTDRRWHR